MQPDSWQPSVAELKAAALNIIAPPLWVLVTEHNGAIVPSRYALAAKAVFSDWPATTTFYANCLLPQPAI
ncbi:MAG TPA: hypothetical protein VFY01_09565 [Rheinheimera sp.]|nr:hypothetical protein [Rheinheimera sp.]